MTLQAPLRVVLYRHEPTSVTINPLHGVTLQQRWLI